MQKEGFILICLRHKTSPTIRYFGTHAPNRYTDKLKHEMCSVY